MSSKTAEQPMLVQIIDSYKANTDRRVKIIDVFLVFLIVVGALQFFYCLTVGSYPFNSFLSGFICAVGCFVLTVSLRMQCSAENEAVFKNRPVERAFADYIFCCLLLFLTVANFIG